MDKRQEDANGEAEEEHVVSTSGTKQSLGAEGTPEHGRGEKGVVSGASESELRFGRAHVLERHLKVENGAADECKDQGCDHLAREGVPGRDFDVVGELEVIGKVERLVARDVAVSLEPDECVGVACWSANAKHKG